MTTLVLIVLAVAIVFIVVLHLRDEKHRKRQILLWYANPWDLIPLVEAGRIWDVEPERYRSLKDFLDASYLDEWGVKKASLKDRGIIRLRCTPPDQRANAWDYQYELMPQYCLAEDKRHD